MNHYFSDLLHVVSTSAVFVQKVSVQTLVSMWRSTFWLLFLACLAAGRRLKHWRGKKKNHAVHLAQFKNIRRIIVFIVTFHNTDQSCPQLEET